MKRSACFILILLACLYAFGKEGVQPPVAKKISKELTLHGDTRIDNYYWLRERDNPEVKAYLQAENEYANAVMKPLLPFQEVLYKEILSHVKQTDMGVPYRDGEFYYYGRSEEGKQYFIFCRKKGSLDAQEEILLDGNELAKDLKFLSLGALKVSNDGNLLAFSTDTTGYREYTLRVKDLRTGTLLPDKVEKVSYSVVWANDNKSIFYTTIDHAKRPYRVNRHILGVDRDATVYEDLDEQYYVGVSATRDKNYIMLGSSSSTTSEVHYIPSDHPEEKPKVILPRETDHEYSVSHRDGLFYILTNKNAKNFRLVSAPVQAPSSENWKEIVPYRRDVMLEDVSLFENHCVISERERGLEFVNIIDLRTNKTHRIEMPEPVYSIYGTSNPEFKTNVFRFGYESLVTPSSVYDYDMDTRKRTLLKQYEVPDYDASQYASERFFAAASDGAKIPVSVVYKKGLKRDGSAPMLLEGYGAYGAPYSVNFNSSRLVLLNRGMVHAIAHVRGGGDMGREWYDQGKLLNKKNTFTDFIAVAEHLIAQKYTSSDRLIATGGSAGGLLMGAITNMRPDLFKAVVSYVPFVDVITTMLDPSIPLVVPEYLEWGNPNTKELYTYMKTYSPYDNISAKAYPSIFVRTSFWDSQVPYWEPAKYVAKLRSMKTDKNLLILKTEIEAGGHGGKSGRYDSMHDDALDYAFMLAQVGIMK